MKSNLFLFFFLAVALLACKKEPAQKGSLQNPGPGREKFKDTLALLPGTNHNDVFVSYGAAVNNFFVLHQTSTSQYNFYKCNTEVKLLSYKTIDFGTEKLISIKASKTEDAFYTLTATKNFSQTASTLINAYKRVNYYFDSTHSCNSSSLFDYQYDEAFDPNPETKGINFSTLNKFDGLGNLLWTKQLDGNYFDGACLETDLEGNVYVLTADKYPITYVLNTSITGPVPYYDPVMDGNNFSIYRFTQHGNQTFKKTISHVKDVLYNSDLKISLNVSKTNISVYNTYEIYTFDLLGNLLTQNKPQLNICYNYISSAISNPYCNRTYVTGYITYNLSDPMGYAKYLAAYNSSSPFIAAQAINYSQLTLIDNSENIYLGGGTYLSKINSSGISIYSGQYLFGNPFNFILNRNNGAIDKENKLYCFANMLSHIAVFKFDDTGKYN